MNSSTRTLEKPQTSTAVLDDFKAGLDAEVEQVSEMLLTSASVNFPLLTGLLRSIIEAGGKRLRPRLAILASRIAADGHQIDQNKLFQVAAAIEMLHTASLVHDDTIDEALLRRGNPTLNSVLTPGTVILAGDYLFAQSSILITKPGIVRVTQIFAECLATIMDGELTQIFSTRQWKQNKEEYYKRIYCKTAVLFATACELGAIVAGGNEDLVGRMRRYGHLMGMGFQIVDDIIDFQPPEITGKATGGDLRQGIVTLPTMYFFEKSSKEDFEYVRRTVESKGATDEQIEHSVELIRASGAFELAYAEARDFINRAKELIADVPESESKTELLRIADYALAREK